MGFIMLDFVSIVVGSNKYGAGSNKLDVVYLCLLGSSRSLAVGCVLLMLHCLAFAANLLCVRDSCSKLLQWSSILCPSMSLC